MRVAHELGLVGGMIGDFDINFQEQIGITNQLISEMERFSPSIGAKFVVFIIPSPYQLLKDYSQKINLKIKVNALEGEGAKNTSHVYNEISSFLKRKGILFVYPVKEFKTYAKQNKVLYYDYLGHWNIEGNRLAAKVMYNYLTENDLIPNKAN